MRISYRPPRDAADLVFVAASWRASLKRSPYSGFISMATWVDVMDPQIAEALARPTMNVLLARDMDAPDRLADLFGYVAWEAAGRLVWGVDRARERRQVVAPLPLVYFVFVKQGSRGNGLARGLMRAAGIDPRRPYEFVCRTLMTDRLRDAGKLPNAYWTPLAGRTTEGASDVHARDEAAAEG